MTRAFRTSFPEIEAYMRSCMSDSAHDAEHVYRVLNYALDIARHEGGADTERLAAACLLHDIGRREQFADPGVDHAICGAEKARNWLVGNGYSTGFADAVKSCIETHRFRSCSPPQSLEAKILFDADKLDVCGAVGVARTLFYKAHVAEPLYSMTEGGKVGDGADGEEPSFMQEYKFKLENVYGNFYTKRGEQLAAKRRDAARHFYDSLLAELRECFEGGALVIEENIL